MDQLIFLSPGEVNGTFAEKASCLFIYCSWIPHKVALQSLSPSALILSMVGNIFLYQRRTSLVMGWNMFLSPSCRLISLPSVSFVDSWSLKTNGTSTYSHEVASIWAIGIWSLNFRYFLSCKPHEFVNLITQVNFSTMISFKKTHWCFKHHWSF